MYKANSRSAAVKVRSRSLGESNPCFNLERAKNEAEIPFLIIVLFDVFERMSLGISELCFTAGGPYNEQLSCSEMTGFRA